MEPGNLVASLLIRAGYAGQIQPSTDSISMTIHTGTDLLERNPERPPLQTLGCKLQFF
jgi:hypothetical protein